MSYLQGYFYESVATVVLLAAALLLRVSTARLVKRYARTSDILEHRTNLVIKYISIFITFLTLTGFFIIWGVETKSIFTTLSAALTVIGVAFFAQWSVLSNITSGMILLFSFPFKIGDIIRIHDKDFPIEAEVEDIRAFHTLLKTRDGEMISYPNNLLLQKGISIINTFYEEKEFTD
jgi:small-conductance mechanosensitive channel